MGSMYTIPPAGVHPTMPPPPAHRAKRALGFAVAGLLLLVVALLGSRSVRPDSAQVFTGRNDFEMGMVLARVLFGASGAAQFTGVVYAFLSFERARRTSAAAFAVALAWAGLVAWWVAQSN